MIHRLWGAAAMTLAVAFLTAGCGSQSQPAPLVWSRAPQVYEPRDLPSDRIVIGRIRNASHQTLRIKATGVKVRDSSGRVLKSSAGFTASYAHGLFGAFQQPSEEPLRELVRLGRIVILDPGATSPVFAAWSVPAGASSPMSLDYGSGRLRIPKATKLTAP